jgi:hypothetical protein
MRCATVKTDTGYVSGVIMAEPTDLPPQGTTLIGLPDDSPVGPGWSYDFSTQVFSPPLGDP